MTDSNSNTETQGGAPTGTDENGQPVQYSPSEAALRERYPSMYADSAAPASAPADGKGEPAPSGAPATVEVEGFKIPASAEPNREALGALREIASAHRLPQDAVQAMVDLAIKQAQVEVAGYERAYKDMRAEWVGELKSDPQFAGSRGEKWDANLALARKAVAAFGNAKLRATFNELGIGDHPELVRFMAKVGAALGDDWTPPAEPSAEPDEDALMRARYPSMFPKE